MIYTCLPSGNMHGWGIAGTHIRAELSKICETRDVSDTKAATVFDGALLTAISGVEGLPMNDNISTTGKYVGCGFCEDPNGAAKYLDNWNKYDVVVCGSSWMKKEMDRIGVKNTAVALQGVDYDIFKPSEVKPKKSPFVVLVVGKAELRKGTDIAIAALAQFMAKHEDSRAIFAIGNFWPSVMHGLERSDYIRYERVSDDWAEQMTSVFLANGVPIDRILVPELMNHDLMVDLYHSAHIGLFCSRTEAGNNMCLTEAVASGLPVIATRCTGHSDIVEPCRQSWFDISDSPAETVDVIVSHMEYCKKHQSETWDMGLEGAALIRNLIGWDRCATALLEALNEPV